MTTGRYHAFAERKTYPMVPRPKRTLRGRVWARLMRGVFAAIAQEHAFKATDSFLYRSVFRENLRVKPDAVCLNRGPKTKIQIGKNVVIGGILAIGNNININELAH